jgi:quercetin dioxygenase-like cupin family protein
MIVKKKKDFNSCVIDDDEASGIKFYPMLTAKDGTPTFAMRLFEINPGGYTPRHQHNWEHEVYIISGSGFVLKDEEKIEIEKGDFIYVESSEMHQFQAGEDGLSIICVVPNEGQPL